MPFLEFEFEGETYTVCTTVPGNNFGTIYDKDDNMVGDVEEGDFVYVTLRNISDDPENPVWDVMVTQ